MRVLHRAMEPTVSSDGGVGRMPVSRPLDKQENRQFSGSPPGEPLPIIHSLQDKQVQERCGINPADKDTLHGKHYEVQRLLTLVFQGAFKLESLETFESYG